MGRQFFWYVVVGTHCTLKHMANVVVTVKHGQGIKVSPPSPLTYMLILHGLVGGGGLFIRPVHMMTWSGDVRHMNWPLRFPSRGTFRG